MVRPWLTVERWRRDRRVPAPRGGFARAAAGRIRCGNAGDGRRRHAVLHADDYAAWSVAARDCAVITLRMIGLSSAFMLIIMAFGVWRRLLGMHGPLGSTQGTEAV